MRELPLLSNGKVDRKLLASLPFPASRTERHVAARSADEQDGRRRGDGCDRAEDRAPLVGREVEIVEDEDERPLGGERARQFHEERADRFDGESVGALRGGVHFSIAAMATISTRRGST